MSDRKVIPLSKDDPLKKLEQLRKALYNTILDIPPTLTNIENISSAHHQMMMSTNKTLSNLISILQKGRLDLLSLIMQIRHLFIGSFDVDDAKKASQYIKRLVGSDFENSVTGLLIYSIIQFALAHPSNYRTIYTLYNLYNKLKSLSFRYQIILTRSIPISALNTILDGQLFNTRKAVESLYSVLQLKDYLEKPSELEFIEAVGNKSILSNATLETVQEAYNKISQELLKLIVLMCYLRYTISKKFFISRFFSRHLLNQIDHDIANLMEISVKLFGKDVDEFAKQGRSFLYALHTNTEYKSIVSDTLKSQFWLFLSVYLNDITLKTMLYSLNKEKKRYLIIYIFSLLSMPIFNYRYLIPFEGQLYRYRLIKEFKRYIKSKKISKKLIKKYALLLREFYNYKYNIGLKKQKSSKNYKWLVTKDIDYSRVIIKFAQSISSISITNIQNWKEILKIQGLKTELSRTIKEIEDYLDYSPNLFLKDPKQRSKYLILGTISHGGMGSVRLIYDPDMEMILVEKSLKHVQETKTINAKGFQNEGAMILKREGLIQKYFVHPNILNCYHIVELGGIDEPDIRLLLEYFPGKRLSDIMKEHIYALMEKASEAPITWKRFYSIVRQIAKALVYLKKNQIVHQDIKPANVLVLESTVKVFDFGISNYLPKGKRIRGLSIPYAPLEQIESPNGGTFASDLYALGVTCYQLLTGTDFYTGEKTDLMEYIAFLKTTVKSGKIPSINVVNPFVSNRLCSLVERLYSFSPYERGSVEEFIKGLDNYFKKLDPVKLDEPIRYNHLILQDTAPTIKIDDGFSSKVRSIIYSDSESTIISEENQLVSL